MAYLGNDLQVAFPVYRNIDDISGSFNSVLKTFPLTVSGVAPVPAPLYSQQCLISVGGVVQRPDDSGLEGFRLSGSNIIFASAPTTGADFFGIILAGADYINAGANFPSGSAAVPSITFDSDLDTGIYNSGPNQVSVTTSGTERLRIDSAGQIESVSLGTAAAPAFSFTTDPNTGIYSPGADQVAISTNGTGRLFVDANGNVAIVQSPVNTPSYTKSFNVSALNASIALRANSGGTYSDQGIFFAVDGVNYSQIYNDGIGQLIFRTGSGLSERLRITSAGLVGIGTSAPGFAIDVRNTFTTDSKRIGVSATDYGTSFKGIYIQLGDSAATGTTAGISNSSLGSLVFQNTDNALIYTNGATPIVFGTTNTERLRITSAGLVGIGTTSPARPLDVNGTVRVSDGGAVEWGGTSAFISGTSASNALLFNTASTERARIDNAGRLLVGTSSAAASFYSTVPARLAVASTFATAHLFATYSNDQYSARLDLLKSRSTTAGGVAVVQSGDELGSIFFGGTDGAGAIPGAGIKAEVDGTPGTNDMPGRLVFSTTADGSSSPTERMRIAQNGVITIQNGAVAVIGTLTDGATITPDFAADCNFTITLGGSRTMANPTNITAGQSGSIFIVQSTGSHTLSWGSYWDFPGGTAPTLSTAAGAVDRIDYIVRSSTSIHTVFTANYS